VFVGFVILVLWLFEDVLLDDFFQIYKTRQIKRMAGRIEQSLGEDDLQATIDDLALDNDCCVLLLDAGGNILESEDILNYCLIHNTEQAELMTWCADAAAKGEPQLQIFPTTQWRQARNPTDRSARDRVTYIYVRPVTLPDGNPGTLIINARVSLVTSTTETVRFQLFLITLIILANALLLAGYISHKVSRPLIATNTAARALGRGSYKKPATGDSYREVAELNRTLTEASASLSRVEELQHELIANISHDLRTPLTLIGGYAEMMRDIPDETTPENLQVIIDETARLNSLVEELLDFSRLQVNNETMDPVPFCLTGWIEGIISRIAKLTAKDGYRVVFEPDERLCTVADQKRIGQVVYNLIGNALTYTGSDKLVQVTQRVNGDTVRISVSDTGKGIAPDEQDLIWNRYYRTHETHRRAVIGSGLGLNIVRTILEKHNAPFGVISTPGEGTTFWFELPLYRDDHA